MRSVSKVLVHPTDANPIFVSTASGIGGIGAQGPVGGPARGVYRSTNALAGTPAFARLTVPTASNDRTVTDMAFEPGNPNNMVCAVFGTNAAGDGGIWRTTTALAATPTFTNVLLLGGSNFGIRVNFAINKVSSTVTVLAATQETSGAACTNLGQDGVLRRSTDGGATWSGGLVAADGFCGGEMVLTVRYAIYHTNARHVYLRSQC